MGTSTISVPELSSGVKFAFPRFIWTFSWIVRENPTHDKSHWFCFGEPCEEREHLLWKGNTTCCPNKTVVYSSRRNQRVFGWCHSHDGVLLDFILLSKQRNKNRFQQLCPCPLPLLHEYYSWESQKWDAFPSLLPKTRGSCSQQMDVCELQRGLEGVYDSLAQLSVNFSVLPNTTIPCRRLVWLLWLLQNGKVQDENRISKYAGRYHWRHDVTCL